MMEECLVKQRAMCNRFDVGDSVVNLRGGLYSCAVSKAVASNDTLGNFFSLQLCAACITFARTMPTGVDLEKKHTVAN